MFNSAFLRHHSYIPVHVLKLIIALVLYDRSKKPKFNQMFEAFSVNTHEQDFFKFFLLLVQRCVAARILMQQSLRFSWTFYSTAHVARIHQAHATAPVPLYFASARANCPLLVNQTQVDRFLKRIVRYTVCGETLTIHVQVYLESLVNKKVLMIPYSLMQHSSVRVYRVMETWRESGHGL